jgi:hypothetical protein
LHRFIPILATLSGAKIVEMPVRHHARQFGVSKYGIMRTFRVIVDLITVKFLLSYATRPMHFFGVAAALCFLAGLTAGILTLGLRQEFGDVIPVLAVESEGAGGTRIRVGWNADDIIPDFLRDIVLGAYIEGFVTAAGEATQVGPAGVGGGVSLEFTLPEGFLMRGTYVPVDNGSLDVLFEP